MKNINELRADLLKQYSELSKDPRRSVQAGELANIAGKALAACKIELEYAHLRGERVELPFLHYDERIVEGSTVRKALK